MRVVLLSVVLALGAGASLAQAADPMEPLKWMAGGTWHAEVPNPNGGAATRIDSHVTQILGGKALAFETSFDGHATYAGTFAYDAAAKQIVFAYPSAQGDWTSGHVSQRGEDFVLDFTVSDAGGKAETFQTTMHRTGANDYTWTLFAPDGGGWKKLFDVKYHRVA